MEEENEMSNNKRCSTCHDIKLITDFNKDKSRRDGYSNKCKICDIKKNVTYRMENREKEILRYRLYNNTRRVKT